MKSFYVLIVIVFFPFYLTGQEWFHIYGQGQSAQARWVIEDYDKGYDILGMIGNYKYIWIQKTNINGEPLWDKMFGNPNIQVGASNIERTMDNGYIICGSWTKFNTSFDAFLIKLNACYEVEWCKTLITPTNYDMGIRVRPTPEGDYVVLGAYFATDPVSNTSLFKFNAVGEIIWHQFYPMDSIFFEDQPNDLLCVDDGYLLSTSRYFPDPGTTGPAWVRHYFIKTDSSGVKQWDLVYGLNDSFYGWPGAVKQSSKGNFYECGSQVVPGTGHAPSFVKVLKDGTGSYHATLQTNTQGGGLSSLHFLNDSILIMLGGWTISDTSHDAFYKTDTLGNVIKINEIIHTSNSYISSAQTHDNKFIAVGIDATGGWKVYAVKVNSDLEYDSVYNQPFTYDSLCPYPIVSSTVDPDCENVYVGIEEPFKNPETTQLKIFPNPANNEINIEIPKYLVISNTKSNIHSTTVYHQWVSVRLDVFDINGQKTFKKEVMFNFKNLIIDVSNWNPGTYVCRLVYNGTVVSNKKLLIIR